MNCSSKSFKQFTFSSRLLRTFIFFFSCSGDKERMRTGDIFGQGVYLSSELAIAHSFASRALAWDKSAFFCTGYVCLLHQICFVFLNCTRLHSWPLHALSPRAPSPGTRVRFLYWIWFFARICFLFFCARIYFSHSVAWDKRERERETERERERERKGFVVWNILSVSNMFLQGCTGILGTYLTVVARMWAFAQAY